jgi:CBS domain-containing protein
VSHRDLLRASLSSISNVGLGEKRAFLTSIKLHEIMTGDVITITPETSIQEAAEIMADERIGCLPVVEDNRLMGMITETDLLHFMAELGRADRPPKSSSRKKRGAA